MNELIQELASMTTRDEAGQHFTNWSKHWQQMEEDGLITIHRPVHEATGIPYDQQYWSVAVTQEGQELVEWGVNEGIVAV